MLNETHTNIYTGPRLKLIVFTVHEHENICIAGLNRRAGYATGKFTFRQMFRVEEPYHVYNNTDVSVGEIFTDKIL